MSTQPRKGNCIYGSTSPVYGKDKETWLESESFCYPNGGMFRRARVKFPDGKCRIVRCGIPDTFFSIPVSKSDADGYIIYEDYEFLFRPHSLPKK